MGIPQPEQPTSPPERSEQDQQIWQQCHDETLHLEKFIAPRTIERIVTTGKGNLGSATDSGLIVSYNAADLWELIAGGEAPEDLAALLGLALQPDNAELRRRTHAFISPLIDKFVQSHAAYLAKAVADEKLSEDVRHAAY